MHGYNNGTEAESLINSIVIYTHIVHGSSFIIWKLMDTFKVNFNKNDKPEKCTITLSLMQQSFSITHEVLSLHFTNEHCMLKHIVKLSFCYTFVLLLEKRNRWWRLIVTNKIINALEAWRLFSQRSELRFLHSTIALDHHAATMIWFMSNLVAD